MSNKEEGLPFQLLRWIKAQQEKELQHQEYMVKKNTKDSYEFFQVLNLIVERRLSLKDKEIMLIRSLMRHYETYFNFTPGQRSVIASFYIKLMTTKV